MQASGKMNQKSMHGVTLDIFYSGSGHCSTGVSRRRPHAEQLPQYPVDVLKAASFACAIGSGSSSSSSSSSSPRGLLPKSNGEANTSSDTGKVIADMGKRQHEESATDITTCREIKFSGT
jgi:hypothetical protein